MAQGALGNTGNTRAPLELKGGSVSGFPHDILLRARRVLRKLDFQDLRAGAGCQAGGSIILSHSRQDISNYSQISQFLFLPWLALEPFLRGERGCKKVELSMFIGITTPQTSSWGPIKVFLHVAWCNIENPHSKDPRINQLFNPHVQSYCESVSIPLSGPIC